MLRPREKAVINGLHTLTEAELLAIIIQTGSINEDVLICATRLIQKYGSLAELLNQSIDELQTNRGIGQVKAIKIKTVKQMFIATNRITGELQKVRNPKDIYLLTQEYSELMQEHLIVICLNSRRHVLGIRDVMQGTIDQLILHPREIFYSAIEMHASEIIIVHNHPSGDVSPSPADIVTTNRLVEISEMVGIQILDHIIIGKGAYYSICNNDLTDY